MNAVQGEIARELRQRAKHSPHPAVNARDLRQRILLLQALFVGHRLRFQTIKHNVNNTMTAHDDHFAIQSKSLDPKYPIYRPCHFILKNEPVTEPTFLTVPLQILQNKERVCFDFGHLQEIQMLLPGIEPVKS